MNARAAVKSADLPLARFLTKVIDGLQGQKSQREIAAEMGYDKPNIISMFKKGEMKVPLDKVPAFARALHVDTAFLFRMCVEQYWPDLKQAIAEVFGDVFSKAEVRMVRIAREVTAELHGPDTDTVFPEELEDEFREWYRSRIQGLRV